MLKSLHRGITAIRNSRILNLSILGGSLSRGWYLARDGFSLPEISTGERGDGPTGDKNNTLGATNSPPSFCSFSFNRIAVPRYAGSLNSLFSVAFPYPRKIPFPSPSQPRETSFYPLISGPAPTFN